MMMRAIMGLAAAAVLVGVHGPRPAAAYCLLCTGGSKADGKVYRPLTIQVEAALDFSRMGLGSNQAGGVAQLDARSGARSLAGLVDMGGLPMRGVVTIVGEPRERVVITFPASIAIAGTSGDALVLTELSTTLERNPRLGADGRLRFDFGGTLRVPPGSDGDFRGAVRIDVAYENAL